MTAAFGPDNRLWRVVPEKWHVYVDYSTDLGKTFSLPVRIDKNHSASKRAVKTGPASLLIVAEEFLSSIQLRTLNLQPCFSVHLPIMAAVFQRQNR